MSGFQRLALVTTLATYGLIVLGGVVRATEAGLGCPDWPRCHGQLTPLPDKEVMIEYSHRAVAGLVSLLVVLTAVAAWRWQRHLPAVFWPVVLALALLLAQVLVGGATVNSELDAELVTLHLALALALLATLTVATTASFRWGRQDSSHAGLPRANGNGHILSLCLLAALAVFGVILSGSYVAGSNAGLAFADWPLFNGQLLAEGGRLQQVHFLHRLAAAAVSLPLLALAVQAWRQRPRRATVMATLGIALVLYLAQVLVGASNIWLRLDPSVRAAHLSLATALWVTLVTLSVLSVAYVRQPLGVTAPSLAGREA